jgi:hypothetical protein
MSAFDDLLEEYLGQADVLSDIRVVVRRLWFYDFTGYPTRMWQGQGRLFTEDGEEWLGTMDETGRDIHVTPRLQDGRDGSSAAYQFSMSIPDIPGESAGELYEALKADQSLVFGRTLTCYLAIFKHGEALRPSTPIKFFKQLTMQSPRFSEGPPTTGNGGVMLRSYKVSITAKDGNSGRASQPNRTYNDATQREYARQIGVTDVDKGCEFVAGLANRTYQVP